MRLAQKQQNKRRIIFVAIAVVITAGCVVGFAVHAKNAAKADSPKYTTVLPKGDSIKDLGGWERISPPNTDAVYAYADTINAVPISVSQQPLPDSFKKDSEGKLSELAKAYNATDKMNADGTTVYIGTSAKGPQSALFVKNNLLILIKSQTKIDDKKWITYIDSLE